MESEKYRYTLLMVLVLLPLISSHCKFKPTIGVVLQHIHRPNYCEAQYTVATYQHFIEQGGAGAVPVFVDQPDSYYEQLIPRLNGILFPGGGLNNILTSPYGNATRKIFNMAKKMNDKGTHFPIWGICQGFEEMTTLPLSPPRNLLSNCSGTEDVLLPLNYTAKASASKLLRGMSKYLRMALGKEKVTPNYHMLCLSTKTFQETDQLNEFYNVLSTNVDDKGLEFVSTFEAKEYPFYGVQWHPEKINYQIITGINTDPTLDSILIGQYFGNFLVQEARKNSNSFLSVKEAARFMFNSYQPKFIVTTSVCQEIYCLNKTDVPSFDKIYFSLYNN